MATRKYTVDEFVKSLRENDPYFQSDDWKNLPDRVIYNAGIYRYPGAKKTVEKLPRIQMPQAPVYDDEQELLEKTSPGYIDSMLRWGIDNESPEWLKQAWAQSVKGLAELASTGSLGDIEIDPNWEPSWMEEIGAGLMSFAFPADIATLYVTGGVGKAATFVGGKTITKLGGQHLIKRQVTSNLAKKGMQNRIIKGMTDYGLSNKIAADVAKRMVITGVELGGYEGLKGGLRATAMGEDAWEGIWDGVVHGGVTGAALGGVGGFLGSVHRNMLFAKDIKLGKTSAFGAKQLTKAEEASWNKLVNTRYFKDKSVEQIDRWLKGTGKFAQYAGEVTAFTTTGNVMKYIEGEEVNMKSIGNDFFFNMGFVGSMRTGKYFIGKAKNVAKKIVNIKTKEENEIARRIKDQEAEFEDLAKDLDAEIENPTTSSSQEINKNVKNWGLEEYKDKDYELLRKENIDLEEAIRELEAFERSGVSEVSSISDIQNWQSRLTKIVDTLNISDELIRMARKDNKNFGMTLEDIEGWKRQVDAKRKELDGFFRRKQGLDTERLELELAEKSDLINFIASKIDKEPRRKTYIDDFGIERIIEPKTLESAEKFYQEYKAEWLEENPNKTEIDFITTFVTGKGQGFTEMTYVMTDKAAKKTWSKQMTEKEIREWQKEQIDELNKWYDKKFGFIEKQIKKESLKGKTLSEIFEEHPNWWKQVRSLKSIIEATKEEIRQRREKDPQWYEGVEGHIIIEKKLMDFLNEVERRNPSTKLRPGGIGRKTDLGDYMVTRLNKHGKLEEVNILNMSKKELLSHKATIKDIQTEYTGIFAGTKIKYETIKQNVEERKLLDYVENDPVIEGIKKIKENKRTSSEKQLLTEYNHKKLITESTLNEKNKTILAHSLGEISATKPSGASTKDAIDLLKHVEKKYDKSIDDLTDSQLEGILTDYINTTLKTEVINPSTNQPKATSTLREKVFGGDINKANYAEIAIQKIVNNLKPHFHKGTGIQEIIGGNILKPKSFKVTQPGVKIDQIRPPQAERTTQKAVSIAGGVEGLKRWSQFIKSKYKPFNLSGKDISAKDVSLLMDVLTSGAGRPGEPTTIRAGNINVKNGTIEVGQTGKKVRTVNVGIDLAKRLKQYASENNLEGNDVLFFNHIESKNRNTWLNKLFSDVIKFTNEHNKGKSGSEEIPVPFVKHLFELETYDFDPQLKTKEVTIGELKFGGKSITEGISPADIFRRILEVSREKDLREREHTITAARSYKKAGDYPEMEISKPEMEITEPIDYSVMSNRELEKLAYERFKRVDREVKKRGAERGIGPFKIKGKVVTEIEKGAEVKTERDREVTIFQLKELDAIDNYRASEGRKPLFELSTKELTEEYRERIGDPSHIKLDNLGKLLELDLENALRLDEGHTPLGGIGGEELAPPVPMKERLIYALEKSKSIHEERVQTGRPLSKNLKPFHEKSMKDKEFVLDVLREGGWLVNADAIKIVKRWRKGHLDWLDNPKNRNQPAIDIEWNKNWADTYGEMLSNLRLETPGTQPKYGKIKMTPEGVMVERTTKEIQRHAFALRDTRGKSFESKDIKDMFPDTGLEKVSQLGETELIEYVNQMRNIESPKSKFGALEQKIKDIIRNDYNIGEKDVTDMLYKLGVKDGLWENIRRKETFENIQLLLKGYEPMAEYSSATDLALGLGKEAGVLPSISAFGRLWHSPARLLQKVASKLPEGSKLAKSLEKIGDKMYNFDVTQFIFKNLVTRANEGVDAILAGTKWRGEKYMFQFRDPTFPRDNLSAKEKMFIDLLESKDPNPVNQASKVIGDMYAKYYRSIERIVQEGKWATKYSKEEFQEYMDNLRVDDYYGRRVHPLVKEAILNRDGSAYEQLLKNNLKNGAEEASKKLEKKINKSTGEIETTGAFNARKTSFEAEWMRNETNVNKVINDIMKFYGQRGTRFDLSFTKERTFTLDRKSKIRSQKTGKVVEVDSYIESYDSVVGHYGAGMSKLLAMLKYFPEFTAIGKKFGGRGLGKNLFDILTADSKEFGVNQEWANYLKENLSEAFGMTAKDNFTRRWEKRVGMTTSSLAAAGLSSFTSGLKNLAIGIPRAIGHFGTIRTLTALQRFMTNHEDLQKRNLNWVKEYGAKQIAMEAQETLWEKVPLIGKYLTMDTIFKFNLMTQTEGVNRIVSAYAGHMMFESFLAAHHGVGGWGDMPMGGKKEIERAYREVWHLSEKEMDYVTKTPHHELHTKNPELMSWITVKVQQYSHVSSQGTTSAFQLPKWMSKGYFKHLTLFQKMAQSTTADTYENFLRPVVKTGNISPLLRATVAHQLSGWALYKFYEKFLGYEVPQQLSDNWLLKWFPYLWRSEFFGLFGEFFNPYTSPIYDKKKGFLDLSSAYSNNQTMMGIIEPVHLRAAKSLYQNVPEMLKHILPGDFGGKPYKTFGQAMTDIATENVVILGQTKKFFNSQNADLLSHKNIKSFTREWMKMRGYYNGGFYTADHTQPYYRALKESFWKDGEQGFAVKYWAAHNYLVTEAMKDGVSAGFAFKQATSRLKTTMSKIDPINLSIELNGRKISKKDEFLRDARNKDVSIYNEAIRISKVFEFRNRRFLRVMPKYRNKYSTLPNIK